jgi:hypothetical protein
VVDHLGDDTARALMRQPNNNGAVPFFTACHFCMPPVVEFLLRRGLVVYDDLTAQTGGRGAAHSLLHVHACARVHACMHTLACMHKTRCSMFLCCVHY